MSNEQQNGYNIIGSFYIIKCSMPGLYYLVSDHMEILKFFHMLVIDNSGRLEAVINQNRGYVWIFTDTFLICLLLSNLFSALEILYYFWNGRRTINQSLKGERLKRERSGVAVESAERPMQDWWKGNIDLCRMFWRRKGVNPFPSTTPTPDCLFKPSYIQIKPE